MQIREKAGPESPATNNKLLKLNLRLEAVADSERNSLPAENIVLEVIYRPPVKRQVQRNGWYLKLHTQLTAYASSEIACLFVIPYTDLDTGADIEIGYAAIGKDKVVHPGHIKTMGIAEESEVCLQESGGQAVLIR